MPVQEMEHESSEVQIIEFHFKFFLENFFSPQQEMTKIEKKETKKKQDNFFSSNLKWCAMYRQIALPE